MIVRVKLFAAARELAGAAEAEVELPAGAQVADLRRALAEKHPQLESLVKRAAFAIDAKYASEGMAIGPHAEVACIPPVSGG